MNLNLKYSKTIENLIEDILTLQKIASDGSELTHSLYLENSLIKSLYEREDSNICLKYQISNTIIQSNLKCGMIIVAFFKLPKKDETLYRILVSNGEIKRGSVVFDSEDKNKTFELYKEIIILKHLDIPELIHKYGFVGH